MNIPIEDRLILVTAALIHDIGKLSSSNPAIYGGETDKGNLEAMFNEAINGANLFEECFSTDGPRLKRISQQALRAEKAAALEEEIETKKMSIEAKILQVASRYDAITGMSLTGESLSEVKAVMEFQDKDELYDPGVVKALMECVYILFPGVSVVLNSGEKALVINENEENILKPTVITFRQNSIMDLSLRDYSDIRVVDIMKTLDNRYIMDQTAIAEAGITVPE